MATNDNDVRRWVIEELYWDPKFDGKAIAVSVDDGEVTLRGTVGSLREKREAKKSSERVYGVESVKNELSVRILGQHGRDDAELRADVLQALMLDGLVPTSIDARVHDGTVTLTGTAEWQFERDEAELVAGNVSGVTGLIDDVRLEPSTPNPSSTERRQSMSNDELRTFVVDELSWEPKVDVEEIAVDAEDGVITLRGTVGSLREKREAKNAAKRVYGVKRVDNKLEVRFLSDGARHDAELRADVLQALMLDSVVPSTIEADVEDGHVRLSGTAQWKYERDEAEHVAGNVRGVINVWDDVELIGAEPDAGQVDDAISKALERSAKLDANLITVETDGRTVTLEGSVSSWAERDEAVAAAWSAPGVQKVKDHLLVSY